VKHNQVPAPSTTCQCYYVRVYSSELIQKEQSTDITCVFRRLFGLNSIQCRYKPIAKPDNTADPILYRRSNLFIKIQNYPAILVRTPVPKRQALDVRRDSQMKRGATCAYMS